VPTVLEFWPEYNSGPLWSDDGKSVDLASLGLPAELAARLAAWNARYDDSKVPLEENDRGWLNEGARLLAEVRGELGKRLRRRRHGAVVGRGADRATADRRRDRLHHRHPGAVHDPAQRTGWQRRYDESLARERAAHRDEGRAASAVVAETSTFLPGWIGLRHSASG
jgi:hypothetical protein